MRLKLIAEAGIESLSNLRDYLEYAARIKALRINPSDIEKCFRGVTQEDLDNLNYLTHEGDILSDSKNNYLYDLNKAVNNRGYILRGGGRIRYIRGDQTGSYMTLFGNFVELTAFNIPEENLLSLAKERELALQVYDDFKKLRWALDRKIRGDKSDCPDFNVDSEERIKRFYESIVNLHTFHSSPKSRPFLIGSPKGASQGLSNIRRNKLYTEVNYWFNPDVFKNTLSKLRG